MSCRQKYLSGLEIQDWRWSLILHKKELETPVDSRKSRLVIAEEQACEHIFHLCSDWKGMMGHHAGWVFLTDTSILSDSMLNQYSVA